MLWSSEISQDMPDSSTQGIMKMGSPHKLGTGALLHFPSSSGTILLGKAQAVFTFLLLIFCRQKHRQGFVQEETALRCITLDLLMLSWS